MREHDFTQNDLARFAKFQRHVAAALEGSRGFLDPGRRHQRARHCRQARRLQFVAPGSERHRADMHRFSDRVRHDIDREDFGQADVEGGVLEGHVGMVLHPKRQDRRIRGQAIEKAEGSRIDPPLRIDRGHQRDRPWHHGADHQLVTVARGQRPEIERHVIRGNDGFHYWLSITYFQWTARPHGPAGSVLPTTRTRDRAAPRRHRRRKCRFVSRR